MILKNWFMTVIPLRNILGLPECIARFDHDSIIRFTANNYNDQMVISSVGKINFEQLKKYIQRYFGFAETEHG